MLTLEFCLPWEPSAFRIHINKDRQPSRLPLREVGIKRPDRNDDGVRQVVGETRSDPQPHREFCWPVFAWQG